MREGEEREGEEREWSLTLQTQTCFIHTKDITIREEVRKSNRYLSRSQLYIITSVSKY